jgi:hypothetical protein
MKMTRIGTGAAVRTSVDFKFMGEGAVGAGRQWRMLQDTTSRLWTLGKRTDLRLGASCKVPSACDLVPLEVARRCLLPGHLGQWSARNDMEPSHRAAMGALGLLNVDHENIR